jgi:hypothetical protein
MEIKFHLLVETEGAVAVGCSALLGAGRIPMFAANTDKRSKITTTAMMNQTA